MAVGAEKLLQIHKQACASAPVVFADSTLMAHCLLLL
jgi:hypothetical protein